METSLKILAALALVLLNGFFVLTEFALVKARQTRIDALVRRGSFVARQAQRAMRNLDAYLAVTQLGITIASLGLGWLGEPAFAHLVEPVFVSLGGAAPVLAHTLAVTTAFLIITFLHIVFGELAPKSVAIIRPEKSVLLTALPMRGFYFLLYPGVWALNGAANMLLRLMGVRAASDHDRSFSEEELRVILAESHRTGAISGGSREMVERAFDFTMRRARQIMVPRVDITFLSTRQTLRENWQTARESGHTRFPLTDGDLDQTLGMIHIKDLVGLLEASGDTGSEAAATDIRQIRREILFVPESQTLERLLSEFQQSRLHMAIVVDEYGGTSGLVTLEDVLEEIVGEIQDEFDEEHPKIHKLEDGNFQVDGILQIEELARRLRIPLRPELHTTISGYVLDELGRTARVGDEVQLGDYTVRVTDVKGPRIRRAVVRPKSGGSGQVRRQ